MHAFLYAALSGCAIVAYRWQRKAILQEKLYFEVSRILLEKI
jgi:hypothetical protein